MKGALREVLVEEHREHFGNLCTKLFVPNNEIPAGSGQSGTTSYSFFYEFEPDLAFEPIEREPTRPVGYADLRGSPVERAGRLNDFEKPVWYVTESHAFMQPKSALRFHDRAFPASAEAPPAAGSCRELRNKGWCLLFEASVRGRIKVFLRYISFSLTICQAPSAFDLSTISVFLTGIFIPCPGTTECFPCESKSPFP